MIAQKQNGLKRQDKKMEDFKMKKLLMAMALMVSMCLISYADGNIIKTYIIENETAQYLDTNIGVTTIYPGMDRILGFQVMPSTTISENVAALYDAISGDNLNANNAASQFAEIECAPESFDGIWFPYPRDLDVGLTVRQGAKTKVIIFYTRG